MSTASPASPTEIEKLWDRFSRPSRAALARSTPEAPENGWPLQGWLEQFAVLPEGDPYTFEGHEQLREIADALDTGFAVIQKSAQEGISTLVQSDVLHKAGSLYRKPIGYFMPTDVQMSRLSKDRVSKLFRNNAHLGGRGDSEEAESISIRPIGRTSLYMLGTKAVGNVKSIPMDRIVFDEMDDIDPMMRRLALERLEHSDFKHVTDLSVPTFPKYGINERFLESDQRIWIVRCPGCRKEFSPEETFPNCTTERGDDRLTACPKCKKPLGFWKFGRWVAQRKSSLPGFRLSRLNSARLTIAALMTAFAEWTKGEHRQILVNNFLALAHLDTDAKLESEWLLANQCGSHGLAELNPAVIGIDVGVPFYACGLRGTKDRVDIAHLSQLRGWASVYELTDRFPMATIVIDCAPETNAAREYRAAYGDRVILCRYDDRKTPYLWDEEAGEVHVNRTESLDASHRLLATQGRANLPRRSPEVELFAEQCANIARKMEVHKVTGTRRYVWAKLKPDHYRHAFNYAVIGLTHPDPGQLESYHGGGAI